MRTLALALLLVMPAAAGTVVTSYGAVESGDVQVDGDEIVITKGKREHREAKSDYVLAEDDEGKLLYAPSFDARLRGYEYIAREARSDLAVKLVKDALSARDGGLARRLLDLAESSGFTGKDAEKLKRRVEDVEGRNPKRLDKKADEVLARVPEVEAIYPDLLVARARVDEANGLQILREALRVDPKNEAALKYLAEIAPKDFALGPAALWLDWRLDLESRGAHLVPEKDLDLLRMRTTWRKDLYGIEAGQLRMITPVKETATVGRCLAYGQVACAALSEVFKTDKPKPRLSKTLLLLLYPDKEEYLKYSPTNDPFEHEQLKSTAGHYSPAEQVSRVVWDRDRDAERRTARVFVHELTHHWINDLDPRFSNAELRIINSNAPWIVEGIATFFEEGIYDPDSGTWSLFDARAASLDTLLAVKKAGKLLPWDAVYNMDRRGFDALPRNDESALTVVRRWRLGATLLTPARLFYEQSGATVHFLYHGEGGAYRARLIDYVTNRYTARKDKLSIEVAFGMTPAELGKKVEAYAERVANGWRP